MAKKKSIYECQNCGAQYPRWQGQCAECNKWNTLTEEILGASPLSPQMTSQASSWIKVETDKTELLNLNMKTHDLLNSKDELRTLTQISEIDRVLGGGMVKGSYILLGGDPGIGKSTLIIQVASQLGLQKLNSLYISGEESPKQTLIRAHRLGLDSAHVQVASENRMEVIQELVIKHKPDCLVIDSIQTVFTEKLTSAPGTVSQVRECASQLLHIAKSLGVIVILIGHVTKDGHIAGPKVLEHMVDTVLSFEGDSRQQFRILRALKNRFGPTNEMGVFQMSSTGLKEVLNPSELFLEERQENVIGSAVLATMEGSRPILCEIQSLTSKTYFPNPRRHCVGLEINRMHLILAVLGKYIQMDFANQDVFTNVIGGLKVNEPAADLAVACSLISSQTNIPLPLQSCLIGEIGLTGEIRGVSQIYDRFSEAIKLGFNTFFLSSSHKKTLSQYKQSLQKTQIFWLKHISEIPGVMKTLTHRQKNTNEEFVPPLEV